MKTSMVASSWVFQRPPGMRPPEISIRFAIAPPTKKPFENGWRMLRERRVSFSISEPSTLAWYEDRSDALAARLQALDDCLCGEHARVHGVVDALERRDVHHARAAPAIAMPGAQ